MEKPSLQLQNEANCTKTGKRHMGPIYSLFQTLSTKPVFVFFGN